MEHSSVNGLVDERTVEQMYQMIVENARRYLNVSPEDLPNSKKWILRTKGSHEIKLEDERIQMINVSDVDQKITGLEIALTQNHRSNKLHHNSDQQHREVAV